MSQVDFEGMSQQELRRYVLDHREDDAAFYAYVDRLHAEGNWIEMPAVESVEDLEKYPEFVAWSRKAAEL
jgi:hypothetical protein